MKPTISLTVLLSACLQCHIVTSATDWHYSGRNIARYKQVDQRPGTYLAYNAELAVDGNKITSFAHGGCSHTSLAYGRSASWTVHLEGSYNITGIIIFNRNEIWHRDRLKNFMIFGNKDYILYDDSGSLLFKDLEIKIPLDGKHAFNSITVSIPAHIGYPDGGASILTLCEVEIFAAMPRSCSYISQPSNGFVKRYPAALYFNYNTYSAGTVIEFFCDKYYRINGAPVIKCLPDGRYNASVPTCDRALPRSCSYISHPSNGFVRIHPAALFFDYNTYSAGTVIKFFCDKYYRINGAPVIECLPDGRYNASVPTCDRASCEAFTAPSHSHLSPDNTSYAINTDVMVYCDEGYEIISSKKSIRCRRNGEWDIPIPVCHPILCDYPGKPENGYYIRIFKTQNETYNFSKLPYGSSIKGKCEKGYESSNAYRTCLASGAWSGEKAVCVPIMCKWPIHIHGGYYKPAHDISAEGLPYNTTLTAACNHTFKLSNNYLRRRCDENGDWENETALCEPLCPLPNVSNALVTPEVSALYEIGSSVRVACEEGFTLLPDQNITCLDNHKWSGTPDCLVVSNTDEQTRSNGGMIAGVSVSTVLVLLSASALAFLFNRRRKHKLQKKSGLAMRYNRPTNRGAENDQNSFWLAVTDEYEHIRNTPADNMSTKAESAQVTNQGHTYTNTLLENPRKIAIIPDRTYCNFTHEDKLPKTAIKVKDLSDLVLYRRDARENFEKQYKSLPQGMTGPHTEAVKSRNRGKNRYKDLYAYDDTRVILDVDVVTDTDYINACYVHGFDRNKKYIASQGPTKEILSDFWKMIWQEDCYKIVMLTNLVEGKKDKCEQYWPDEGSETYGKITVSINTTEMFSEFLIRNFTIQKENSSSRTVSQFHFTAWPDKSVPRYASSLVQFMHKVKHAQVAESGPIVVHCSAGVGRTGTFIALDILTDQGSTGDYVDVLSTVATLRKQRVNLVQTLEQYIFVHHALVESLMLSTSALSAAKFPEAFRELLEMDQAHKKTKICLEFETLKQMSPVAEECQYVSSKLVRNRHKNRYSNVLPAEEFMPKLSSDDATSDASYINAVFLPSYKEKKAFIITQTPLESTREDFWRLIWEHDIHTVVMMNNREEVQDSEVYWPGAGDEVKFGNMYIRNDETKDINKHRMLSVTIKYYLLTRSIKLIQCGGWQAQKSLPESPETILSLMRIVQKWQQQNGNQTILVHCMNGVDKSGLFCVISAVIERMKIEQDVAISQVIEEMRNAREQIIPSVEQYKFCHEAVLVFLDQNDTYANFAA